MKQSLTKWLLLSIVLLLCGVGVYRSQEAPEPPDAPEVMSADGPFSWLASRDGSALGVGLKDVSAEQARALKLPGEDGAYVIDVLPESAAAQAGLEKGDVIVGFAGERVRSVEQLRRLVRETPPGRNVSLEVVRNGQARTLSAQLQARKNSFHYQAPQIQVAPPFPPDTFDFRGLGQLWGGGRRALGISGDELTSQLATFFGVKQGKGVLVREVVAGSPAAKVGLKAGDVIVAVDGKSVATVAELRRALELKPGVEKRTFNLTLVRDHHELTVSVELAKPEAEDREQAARAQKELKAHLAEAQTAMQEAQKHLSDQQRLLTDQMRQQLSADAEKELRARLADAQTAMQEAQKHLSDQQRLLSDQMRQAMEQYRQAMEADRLNKLNLQQQQLEQLTDQGHSI